MGCPWKGVHTAVTLGARLNVAILSSLSAFITPGHFRRLVADDIAVSIDGDRDRGGNGDTQTDSRSPQYPDQNVFGICLGRGR